MQARVRRTAGVEHCGHTYGLALTLAVVGILPLSARNHLPSAPPPGVEKVCVVMFDIDPIRPARVENSALPCLRQAAQRLKASPDRKLVLVGVKDPTKDHEPDDHGSMREEEDTTGLDVRLEDLSAYRAVNTKWYLVRYLHADPSRILPTTDESNFAQTVTFYLVPASADFNHNFLGTTKTNEKPCTVTPCYSSDEEALTAQPRPRIVEGSKGYIGESRAERRALAAQQRSRTVADTNKDHSPETLAPLPPRPTPEHPATTSIIPQ